MNLKTLIEKLLIKKVEGNIDVEVSEIQSSSNEVKENDLFICLKGYTSDGHDFALEAVEKGAVAVVTEKKIELPSHIAQIIVPDTRRALSIIANVFYKFTNRSFRLIGITGTNGKTTTTHLIESIVSQENTKTAIIGTIGVKVGNIIEESKNTTPDNLLLQKYFKKMTNEKIEYTMMEVSSHALVEGRVRGVEFDCAIFTNLTQDHLDFHETMEKYADAKSILFSQLGNEPESKRKVAILNADDPISKQYLEKTAVQVIMYGIDNEADVRAINIKASPNGISFLAKTFIGDIQLNLKLMGKFNVYNALAAISACIAEGFPLELIKSGLEKVEGVAGRFQPVNLGQEYSVIVDYSHTPDSLENALYTVKEFTTRKTICIFGCGGNRDKGKRPVMGKIGAQLSDILILTSDNPRAENPNTILEEIKVGIPKEYLEKCLVIENRQEAIKKAIELAQKGDSILIAGKGHETYQILKEETIYFDDREVARQEIERRQAKN